jgi:hypothetical protein
MQREKVSASRKNQAVPAGAVEAQSSPIATEAGATRGVPDQSSLRLVRVRPKLRLQTEQATNGRATIYGTKVLLMMTRMPVVGKPPMPLPCSSPLPMCHVPMSVSEKAQSGHG